MSKLAHSNDKTISEIEARNRCMDEQANYFAMCLLMPEEAFKEEAAKYAGAAACAVFIYIVLQA